ncbi:cysteine hydrolase family protein [Massilia endophytica]|uniref:cysteine hydrolase family protein n=1 Tax=Massilia endophytica TaxID=2899220 RepID=UPI001E4C888F|nr:cysteine hydrolase family protein [Massilia endophytica]UGQ48187.1 cysteine hydrolase [Massilia endophytica]
MSSALLIIDMQQELCFGGEAAFEARRVVERINIVSAKARAAHIPVFMIQHEEEEGALQHGSEGWQLAQGLATAPSDLHVRKHTPDSFHQTPLQALLEERGITSLAICGLQSDFCVDTTTRRALALGYPVTLVTDGHSTVDNGVLPAAQISAHHTRTLSNIGSFGPRVTPLMAAEVQF